MTIREDPPSAPPCPRCHSTNVEFDENLKDASGRGWWCNDCSTTYAGTASEAARHAAATIAEQALRDDLANKPSTLKALRGEA